MYVVLMPPATPRLRPDFPHSTYFTWFFRPQLPTTTRKPSPEHLFYLGFVPATPQLRPEPPRSKCFTWFSCPKRRRSYTQTIPGAYILCVFHTPSDATTTPRPSCPQHRHSYAQTFPGARILRGFRAPSHATTTPRPSALHVFYMVFVCLSRLRNMKIHKNTVF